MSIHIVPKQNSKTVFFAFCGYGREIEFHYLNGKIFSEILSASEKKAIQNYFDNKEHNVKF